uniref:Uncharacterized protein n=1 Tax=Acanthochromis polyacanthus TaxID=80966 RepID=A0A3Q1I5F3_9TELE
MNVCGHTKILGDNITPSQQMFGRRGIFQHDKDPQHAANITQFFFEKNAFDKSGQKLCHWTCISQDHSCMLVKVCAHR